MAAWTFRSNSGITSGSNPIVLTAPAGTQANDLILAFTGSRSAIESLVAISGWTVLASTGSTANPTLALLGRIAAGDSSDDISSEVWTGATASATLRMASFYGGGYTDLSSIVVATAPKGSTSNTANAPIDALTVPNDNCLVVGMCKKQKTVTSDGLTWSMPSGISNKIDESAANGTVVTGAWGYTQQTTKADISAGSFTQSVAESLPYASLLVALRTGGTAAPMMRYQQMLRGN